jgi:hypothetical protein
MPNKPANKPATKPNNKLAKKISMLNFKLTQVKVRLWQAV